MSGLGLTAVEGYHAGSVRQQLIQQLTANVPGLGMNVETFALVRFIATYWQVRCYNKGPLSCGRCASEL